MRLARQITPESYRFRVGARVGCRAVGWPFAHLHIDSIAVTVGGRIWVSEHQFPRATLEQPIELRKRFGVLHLSLESADDRVIVDLPLYGSKVCKALGACGYRIEQDGRSHRPVRRIEP